MMNILMWGVCFDWCVFGENFDGLSIMSWVVVRCVLKLWLGSGCIC